MIAITPWILVLAATCHQDPEPVTTNPVQAPVAQTPAPVPPAVGDTGDAHAAAPNASKPNASKPDASKTAASETDAHEKGAPTTSAQEPAAGKPEAVEPDAQPSSADQANPDEPDEPRRDAGGWIRMDGVALIINQDITTKGDLERQYYIKYRDTPVKNQDQFTRLQNDILSERVNRILAMQAGEDLGISEELVKLQVNEWFEAIVKNHGGVVEMTKLLEDRHQTPQDLRRDRREQIYVKVWEGLVTGEGAGAGKRPIRDRFIRPGELKFHYNEVIQDSGSYGVLGGTIETLTLQRLLLDPKEHGGLDKTIDFAQSLRQRILDGDDMSDLVRSYGKEKDGMMRDVSLPDLKRQFPSMGRFAERAQVDDVSEPMRLPLGDGTYVQILRLVDRKPGVKPELNSQEVQNVITTTLQQKLDDYHKELGYADLISASYIWPDQRRKKK